MTIPVPQPHKAQPQEGTGNLRIPDLPPNVHAQRGTSLHAATIARRLVSQQNPDLDEAARRLIAAAPGHGIDFKLSIATFDRLRAPHVAREACLAVPGPGRTAMLYLSEPSRPVDAGPDQRATTERAHCIDGVCRILAKEHAGKTVLAQSLPDPAESWALEALRMAGFLSVGTLLYMRRAPRADDRLRTGRVEPPAMPDGLSLVASSALPESQQTRALLAAMDASYEDTLDCPELCGLRQTSDILQSHRSTGAHDPNFWWLVMRGDTPLACLFLTACPNQQLLEPTVELVYLGLAKELRGKGLAKTLMSYGISVMSGLHAGWPMTCAVDERNAPAVRLYDALGFRTFARRTGMVRALSGG